MIAERIQTASFFKGAIHAYQKVWVGFDTDTGCYVRRYIYGRVGEPPHYATRLEVFKKVSNPRKLIRFCRWK